MRKRIIPGLAIAALAVCIGGAVFTFRENEEAVRLDYETFTTLDKSAAVEETIKTRIEATLENIDSIESAEITFSGDNTVDVDIKPSGSNTLNDDVQDAVKRLVASSIEGVTTEDVDLNIV